MYGHNISEEKLDQFHEDGFLLLDAFLSEELVNEALLRFDPVFSGEFETGVLPDKVKWQKGVDPENIPRSLCNVWKADKKLARIVLAEQIGKVSSQLMGWPGTRCNQDFIMCIPPGAGTICFHQDNSYQDWHVPGDLVTCWIALSSTKAVAGTLEYVRGSHKWPLGPRVKEFAAPENYHAELDAAAKSIGKTIEIVSVELPAGGVAFHHGNIWHGSNYNRSPHARYSISSHCMSSEAEFHPTIPSPMFNHYKRFNDLSMDESFFPILWTEDGRRSSFLKDYLD
jgi:phytanoyl-CoA hydroxylase